jgi:hypothetical protein
VSTHDGSGWNVTYTRRFVWSDWLPVLELKVEDDGQGGETVTILRKCTWGLDLSGDAIDGAGGEPLGGHLVVALLGLGLVGAAEVEGLAVEHDAALTGGLVDAELGYAGGFPGGTSVFLGLRE